MSQDSKELNEGQILIFKNSLRKPESREPEYWGKCKIDGKERRISLWLSESAAGNKYFQGKISEYGADKVSAEPAVSDVPF